METSVCDLPCVHFSLIPHLLFYSTPLVFVLVPTVIEIHNAFCGKKTLVPIRNVVTPTMRMVCVSYKRRGNHVSVWLSALAW